MIALIVTFTTIAAQLRTFAVSGRLLVLLTAVVLAIYGGFGVSLGPPTRATTMRNLGVTAAAVALGSFTLFAWHIS